MGNLQYWGCGRLVWGERQRDMMCDDEEVAKPLGWPNHDRMRRHCEYRRKWETSIWHGKARTNWLGWGQVRKWASGDEEKMRNDSLSFTSKARMNEEENSSVPVSRSFQIRTKDKPLAHLLISTSLNCSSEIHTIRIWQTPYTRNQLYFPTIHTLILPLIGTLQID